MKRAESPGKRFALYRTEVGWGGVVAGDAGLLEVVLPFGSSAANTVSRQIADRWPEAREGSKLVESAALQLTAYFAGERKSFDLLIDHTGFTPFQRQVYALVSAIPFGAVMTYGDVARELGRPGAARGVGAAMAANPLPVVIPCHRVVGATGCLTGYSGPGGLDAKAWLLRLEGVGLDERGRIMDRISIRQV
jgi:methylated-DNA-[protein]-cysteine S-methyltransferase